MKMSSGARPAPEGGNPTRDKILSTARELFYQEGIRAVGVDTIVEQSGVAKTSLYRWFSTKDDLIASFLLQENDDFWAQWDKVDAKFASRPREALLAHLKWLEAYIASPRFRGCPFINTAAEFRDPTHPGRLVCHNNKLELHHRLAKLTTELKVDPKRMLADQLLLLIDGAFANSQVLGKEGPSRNLKAAGEMMIAAAIAASKPR
jgi:AcrR family transcriptional regulator